MTKFVELCHKSYRNTELYFLSHPTHILCDLFVTRTLYAFLAGVRLLLSGETRPDLELFTPGIDCIHNARHLWAREILPPIHHPGHHADETDDPKRGTAVVHVIRRDRPFLGEVEVYTSEEQKREPDRVDVGAPFPQGVCAGDHPRVGVARQQAPQADEQGRRVGEVETERGDGDDGAEAFVGGEVDAVQAHLDQTAQDDAVDGHLGFLVHLGEDGTHRQAVVAGKGPQGAGALGHQAVGADEDDDGDHGGQGGGAGRAAGAVVEDLDQGHAGGRGGGGLEVADAEEGGDEEDEARHGAEVDGQDDGLGSFFTRR